MSARRPDRARSPGACPACLRRSWLLSQVSGPLECRARDRGRLVEVLALPDGELLKAVAGRRAAELEGRYAGFDGGELPRDPHVQRICRHHRDYPQALDGRSAPHMLEVTGEAQRLVELTEGPVVAIVGSTAASDYGMAIAASLARGLAASGVTVVARLTDGIAVAAHSGALDAGAGSVVVMGGGLRVACPGRRRSLYERVMERGCAISELPPDCNGRRWGQLASERIVVELAAVTVVVEAHDTPADLAGGRIAQSLGRILAAIPGRVSSPLSRGTHALLMDGASLVRGAQDVLELLGPLAGAAAQAAGAAAHTDTVGTPAQRLPATLSRTLELVGAGCDTPAQLTRAGEDPAEVLLALSELELMGLLGRGDGGRYLPQ
jgi:DNA processing protein